MCRSLAISNSETTAQAWLKIFQPLSGAMVASSAPFPWDESPNGGFSANEPWMPLAPNYRYANAKTEFANDFSHVGVVKIAAAMRKSPAVGPQADVSILDDNYK